MGLYEVGSVARLWTSAANALETGAPGQDGGVR